VFINGTAVSPNELNVSARAAVAKYLDHDSFLVQFSDVLCSIWKKVLLGYRQGQVDDPKWRHLLKEAVMLRDCSFIIRCFSNANFEIKLIDLEHKSDSKIDYYIFEVQQMDNLLLGVDSYMWGYE
jgi:hypothetical protein